jgi:type II secretory pathway component PulC
VLTWSRGSIGVVGLVFEVRTQVDLDLTNVSRFDSGDSAISVNDANLKPGASQPTPLRRISSRDSITRLERFLPS